MRELLKRFQIHHKKRSSAKWPLL